jgi:hypothetical protein
MSSLDYTRIPPADFLHDQDIPSARTDAGEDLK